MGKFLANYTTQEEAFEAAANCANKYIGMKGGGEEGERGEGRKGAEEGREEDRHEEEED